MLKKILDAIDALVAVAIAGGCLWSLLKLLPQVEIHLPQTVVLTAAIVTLATIAWLAELFMPLQAVSEVDWVYVRRPKARLRTMDLVSLGNLLGFAVLGALIGVILGNIALWGSAAVLLRILPLLNWRHRLPGLLAAGRRRTVGTAGLYVHDSELVSQGFAIAAGRFRPAAPTANLWVLFFRRLHRRYYLLLIALALVGSTVLFSGLWSQLAAGYFLLGWSVLTAAIVRCANFLPLVDAHHLSLTAVVVFALFGAAIMVLILGRPLMLPLVALGIGASGWRRSKPRKVTNFTVIDTGLGITAPIGQIQYFGAGLIPASVVAGIFMLAF